MPDQHDINYLISLGADMSAASRAGEALRLLEDAFKKLGQTMEATDKVSIKSAKVIQDEFGRNVLAVQANVTKAKGVIQELGFSAQKGADGLGVLDKGLSLVSKTGKEVATVGNSIASTFASMAQRALLVAPIWMVIREAIRLLTSTVTDAIKFMNDFDESLARIQIAGNLTREEVIQLSRDVLKLGEVYGFSFGEMSEATKAWVAEGKTSAEVIILMKSTMQLAILTGESLGKTVDQLDTIMDSFNITGTDTARIVNSVAVAMKANGVGAEDVVAGLKKIAPLAAEANLSLEETLGILTAIQNITNRSGERTGDAFSAVLNRINTTSAPQLQALSRVAFFEKGGQATTEATGSLRDINDILTDVAANWGNLTDAERQNFSILAAGKRSVTEFDVLMKNFNQSIGFTIDAMLGQGKATDSVSIATATLKKNVEELQNSWHQAFASDEFAKFENFIINGIKKPSVTTSGAFGTFNITSESSKQKQILEELADSTDKQAESLMGVVNVYKKLKSELDSINSSIQQAKKDGNDPLIKSLEAQKDFITQRATPGLNNSLKPLNIQLDSQNLENLVGDLDSALSKVMEASIKKSAESQITRIKLELDNIGGGIFDSKGEERERLKVQFKEKQVELAEQEALLNNTNGALDAKRLELIKQTHEVKKKINEEDLLAKQILEKVSEEEANQLSLGVSSQQAKINAFRMLQEEIRKNNVLTDKNGVPIDPSLNSGFLTQKKAVNNIQNQRASAMEELGFKTELQELKSLGANEIELQKRLISLEATRAARLQDNTKYLQEQEKLLTLLNEKSAQYSQELKASISSNLKDLLNSKQDLQGFLSNIGNTITDRIQTTITDKLAGDFLEGSGFGKMFGDLNVQIESGFSTGATEAHAAIYDAHVQGGAMVATQIASAYASSAGTSAAANASGGIPWVNMTPAGGQNPTGGSTSAMAKTTTASSNLASFAKYGGAALGAVGTVQSIQEGNPTNAAMSGAMAGMAFGPWGAAIGAGIGFIGGALNQTKKQREQDKGLFGVFHNITSLTEQTQNAFGQNGWKGVAKSFYDPFGLFSMFKKKKPKIDVEEDTKEFQVASKIDVTNNKLDIVNRNLVALKQSFETYALPNSAAFATKSSIEDNFSLSARRGLI